MRRDNRNRTNSRDYSRDNRNFRGSFNNRSRQGSYSGPREMHKATCSECNCECEVPFKPTEGKPVYCRECFNKRKDRY